MRLFLLSISLCFLVYFPLNGSPSTQPEATDHKNAHSSSKDASASDSQDDRGLQILASSVLEHMKNLEERVSALSSSDIDYKDKALTDKLSSLGCLSIGIIDVPSVTASVVLFPHGVASRLRLNIESLEKFSAKCKNKLLPLAFHQHEDAVSVHPRGMTNEAGGCGPLSTGGHHDPGYACGETGTKKCLLYGIPPSSALDGRPQPPSAYVCTPEVYALRPFSCHAGDITGKLGFGVDTAESEKEVDIRLMALDWHADNPCVASDLGHSLVVHCHSTNFRMACGRFHRLETAGEELPELLLLLLRTGIAAAPHAEGSEGLLASFIFAQEAEKRVDALERFAAGNRKE